MRRLGSCLRFEKSLICFIVFLLSGLFFNQTASALTASFGQPYHGYLVNGIPFPTQFRGYQLREQERTYTTPELAGALLDAIESVRAAYPNTCDVYLGDFTVGSGGAAAHHRSHQNGRDVDVGMYAKDNRQLHSLVPMNEENLDAAKTWCLMEGLLRSQRVQYIFLDRNVQKIIKSYAASHGVDQAYLDQLFGNVRGSIVQHVVNHVDHMHVRFFTPWSTLAAHIAPGDDQKRAVIEMAQQSYLPKKVQYYAKGTERGIEALAQSFGVTSRDLCRWNNLHGNEVLAPGSCLVFYKRGFELEPVHLAQSLQPYTMPEPPVQVASLPPERETVSDASVSLSKDADYREKKAEPPAASSTTYTAHRGDTLDKVAKQHGMDVKTLRELNGLKKRSHLRAGQKLKLAGARVAQASSSNKEIEPSKAPRAGSIARAAAHGPEARKAKAAAPVTYTVGRGDNLGKIARQTGLSVETLRQINGIGKTVSIKPGQILQLAQLQAASKSEKSPPPALKQGKGRQVTAKAAQPTQKGSSAKHEEPLKKALKKGPAAKAAPLKDTKKSASAPAASKASAKKSTAASKAKPTAKAAPASPHKNASKASPKSAKANIAPAHKEKAAAPAGKVIRQAKR